MANTGFTLEIPTKVAPHRVFTAGCVDMHNLAPKIVPEFVTGAKIFNGDSGAGTIKHFTFTEALPYSYYKEHVDALDKEKLECVYRLIEGGDLGSKVSSALYRLNLEPLADGGCIFKMSSEYTILPGVDAQQYVAEDKELSIQLFKAVEAYLLANPDAYA